MIEWEPEDLADLEDETRQTRADERIDAIRDSQTAAEVRQRIAQIDAEYASRRTKK